MIFDPWAMAHRLLSFTVMAHTKSPRKRLKNLVPHAETLDKAELVMVADCAPKLARDVLPPDSGSQEVVVSCPVTDDYTKDFDRLVNVLWFARISGLTVVTKKDDCCASLTRRVREAIASGGNDVRLRQVVVDDDGEVVSTRQGLGLMA